MAGAVLGDAYVNVIPSAKGIQGSLTSTLGGEAQAAGTSLGSKIGSFAKKALASAAIGKVVVDAFKQGAALEQSIGGVETLYGKSADVVKNYAKDAWKSAGIDANSYMEQSTSFAAALVSSLGGNTKKAAEAANTAITDMADNSNKMGTSLDLIQNAYQGFAKQNYTMLDNLKLGYGGTKTEMERLLADAQEISGVEYDINNLSDVYSAIHVIQGELGITGTTSKEAASTLSGSFASMKAAAQDFMGNLVLGEDLAPSMKNLAESACTFLFDNLVPALGRVLKGLPTVAITLLQNVIPNMLNHITDLVNKFAEGDGLSGSAKKAISKFAEGIGKALPVVIKAVGKLTLAIIKAIAKLPGKLLDYGKSMIKGLAKGLKSYSIKLPHIYFKSFGKIPWGIGGKGVKPDIGIKWYKTGAIFDSASLIGVGEAGPEAVVPLSGKQMQPFAKAIASEMGGGGNTYNFGDITIDVSSLDDIATVEDFALMMKRAKAFA